MSSAVSRKPYPSDVSNEEWSLVVLYLSLVKADAPQREHVLRELFNGLRYVIRYGIALWPRDRFTDRISPATRCAAFQAERKRKSMSHFPHQYR